MGYEIDFLAVGDNSQSGDAIALRYGDLHGHRDGQRVVVIDGGFSDDGSRLAELICTHYKTETVDLVVSSHPDCDHAKGLKTLLGEMSVGRLWMHLPWEHTDDIASASACNDPSKPHARWRSWQPKREFRSQSRFPASAWTRESLGSETVGSDHLWTRHPRLWGKPEACCDGRPPAEGGRNGRPCGLPNLLCILGRCCHSKLGQDCGRQLCCPIAEIFDHSRPIGS